MPELFQSEDVNLNHTQSSLEPSANVAKAQAGRSDEFSIQGENPSTLARDIQCNVGLFLQSPNEAHLEALRNDSHKLEDRPDFIGGRVERRADLRKAVQAQLDQMEKGGVLPKISIDNSGNIFIDRVL